MNENGFLKGILDLGALVLGVVIAYGAIMLLYDVPFSPGLPVEIFKSAYPTFPARAAIGVLLGATAAITVSLVNPYRVRFGNTRYGDSKWAGSGDLKRMKLFADTGVILGVWRGKFLRANDYLSTMMLAPPESMKSVGLMIPNLLSCGDSMLVFDVKYDLYNKTSKRRSQFSEVMRFSPAEPNSVRFNPLGKEIIGEDWDDIVGTVERLSTIIYPDPKGGQDAHWVNGARIVFVFFALQHIHDQGETSIPRVRSKALETTSFVIEDDDGGIETEGTKAWIEAYLDENEDDLPDQILLRGNDLLGRPEKEFGSVFSTFTTGLEGFGDSRCERAFSGCDFTPQSLRETRTTVYVCVKDNDCKRFATPIRILLETLNSHFLSELPKDTDFGVTNLLDEFPRLGKMDVIMEAPALQRSNRVRSIFCAQAESQIEEIYGRDKLKTVKNSCAFHIYPAQNDDELNKKISEACGTRTDLKPSESRSQGKVTSSKSEEMLPLILPQEVGALPPGEVIIHRQNFRNRPIRARLALFFENKQMRDMIGSIEEIKG